MKYFRLRFFGFKFRWIFQCLRVQSRLSIPRHDLFVCVVWLMHMCTWLIQMCDMTHSHVWHDSFIGVTSLIYLRDIRICGMTHAYMRHTHRHEHTKHANTHTYACTHTHRATLLRKRARVTLLERCHVDTRWTNRYDVQCTQEWVRHKSCRAALLWSIVDRALLN